MQTTFRGELVEPYAEALLSLAQAHNLIDQFQQDTQLILELLANSSELQQFLASPLIKAEAKKNVLRQLTVDKVHGYFLNFLMLLVDRRRINFLGPICEQYRALVRSFAMWSWRKLPVPSNSTMTNAVQWWKRSKL